VGTYCYVAVGSAARGASAPTEAEEGRGILWRLLHSLFKLVKFNCLYLLYIATVFIANKPRAGSGVVRMDRSVSWPDVVQGD